MNVIQAKEEIAKVITRVAGADCDAYYCPDCPLHLGSEAKVDFDTTCFLVLVSRAWERTYRP